MYADKLPPHNAEAEQAVIGSLLIDGSVLELIAPIVKAEDFYYEANRLCYLACTDLHGRGDPIDQVSVSNELAEHGRLDEVGGAAHLNHLIASVPTSVHAEYYAELIAGAASKRALIQVAGEMAVLAYSDTVPPEDAIYRARDLVQGMRPQSGSGVALRSLRLSDVEPEEVRWLWYPYVPIGKVTLVAGDPGLGKSYCLHDLAARVSAGGETPDRLGTMSKRSVVILSAEDGIADTIRPRIDGQGGDPSMIHVVESVIESDGRERMVSLTADIERLSSMVTQTGASLVVIDPINAYLGKVDSHKDAEVRQVLSPLKLLAERTGAAVVCVMHLNKSVGQSRAIYRVMASIGFTAAARSVLLVGEDPSDAEVRVVIPIKASVAKKGAGITFTINSEPALVWGEQTALSADDLLGPGVEGAPRATKEEALAFLKAALADGPREANTVQAEARQAGIAEKALRSAREAMGITRPDNVYRVSAGNSGDGRWWWRLDTSDKMPRTTAVKPGADCGEVVTTLFPQSAFSLEPFKMGKLPTTKADAADDVGRV
jgi:putative DNA primase/helicase